MKKTLIIALAAAISLGAWAKGNISGKVIKKETGEPLEFATIQLVDANTGKPLAIGTASDIDGAFTLDGVADGNYLVRVSCIGSVTEEQPVKVAGKNVRLSSPIVLADDALLLQEVVVEGVRGQMRFDLDKKVFNVDANIAASGASASELLESIPSVEVDQDGEVSLRGNSSVTIWINGKESGLTADNRAQILEQLPAESIDRVEVITNPSAKYDPEGTAGIINIILKRDRRSGYFGSAEAGANSRGGANASFNINWNSGKWETYASAGLRYRRNNGGSRQRRDYDSGHFLYSDGRSHNYGNNLFLRAGATYHVTSSSEFFANAFGMFGHRWGRSQTDYRSDLPAHWLANQNISKNSGDMRGTHAELGFTHRWTDNHTLDILLGYNHWGGPSWNSYLQHQTFADPDPDFNLYQEQEMDMNVNGFEAKVDYVNQLNSWLKLEAGYNGKYDKEDTPVSTLEGTAKADLAIIHDLYNRFIYRNDISAFYATLGGKTGHLSFSGGLRAETWQVRTQSLAFGESKTDVPTFRKNNFALFPSVFLSYSLPADNEIQVNYTRRIRRPWGGQMNSFRNISNPTNISYGNPELEPQYTNSFELNYIKTWDYHIISLSAYYRATQNDINRISFLDNNVLYTTFANVGRQENSGCEIVIKNNLFSRLDITTTANLYNNHQRSWSMLFENEGKLFPVSGPSRNDFAWDIRSMISLRLPWSLSFQATGRYNSRRLTAQGSREPGWDVDAGLRKNLGNWSLSLNCRDIFDSRKFHSLTYGDGYAEDSQRWRGGRRLQFTVKYSFGNMKAKRDRRRPDASSEPMDASGYSDFE